VLPSCCLDSRVCSCRNVLIAFFLARALIGSCTISAYHEASTSFWPAFSHFAWHAGPAKDQDPNF
jgi:hypothetical protein